MIKFVLGCYIYDFSGGLDGKAETWVQFLGWKDPLEKEVATHSSILAWRISWREETDWLEPKGSQRVRHWGTSLSPHLWHISNKCEFLINLPFWRYHPTTELFLKNEHDQRIKCCTQYASKFGKLSSCPRTGKGQFSFQSQRKAILKNAQTTAQLH